MLVKRGTSNLHEFQGATGAAVSSHAEPPQHALWGEVGEARRETREVLKQIPCSSFLHHVKLRKLWPRRPIWSIFQGQRRYAGLERPHRTSRAAVP